MTAEGPAIVRSRPGCTRWAAVILLGGALAGCAVPTAGVASAGGTTGPAAATSRTGAPATDASTAVLAEVNRELQAMRTTRYQHHTDVDESRGSYDYDCSGLVDYVLGRVDTAGLDALPITGSTRPLAADIEHRLSTAATGSSGPWQAVTAISRLRPGDLIAWLATEDSTTGDTGHVMIVTATPQRSPDRAGEWLVHVADSTLSPHADDTRHTPTTGLGTGVIGLLADSGDHPVAFYWRGDLSPRPTPTPIALGRPT